MPELVSSAYAPPPLAAATISTAATVRAASYADAGIATAVAKAHPDAGMFTIKTKDAAMAEGFAYLPTRAWLLPA